MEMGVICQIESISYDELLSFMRQQVEDAFPSLKDNNRLKSFTQKLYLNAELCLCREDRTPVGMIAFYANRAELDFAFIPHVYVSRDYRKMGVFSRMLQEVEKYVKNKGYNVLKLEVEIDNTTALRAYHQRGFYKIEYASQHSYYLYKEL